MNVEMGECGYGQPIMTQEREREMDAGGRGENWRQILEVVEEMESGAQVGRWPSWSLRAPNVTEGTAGDTCEMQVGWSIGGKTVREFSSNYFLFSRK